MLMKHMIQDQLEETAKAALSFKTLTISQFKGLLKSPSQI